MFLKSKILEIFTQTKQRFFKVNSMSNQTRNVVQFHGGGDDYCPLKTVEGLGGNIGDNPVNGFVIAWRDDIERKSLPGEKRIYSATIDNDTGKEVQVAEIYLKNDGTISISGKANIVITTEADLTVNSNGKTTINAKGEATLNGSSVNLGGSGGSLVLTEKTVIKDGEGRLCSITSNTTKTKAV